jgi:hypothetical protein
MPEHRQAEGKRSASMSISPRQRFLSYVKSAGTTTPVISPFLPHPDVIQNTLRFLHLPVTGEAIADEVALSRHLGYQPMFMTECSALIFHWQIDESRSTPGSICRVIATPRGEWTWEGPREAIPWNDDAPCPVQTLRDHELLVAVCEQVADRAGEIRAYYRDWRRKVGEDGVIVIGHPHPTWLGFQINPTNVFFQWKDWNEEYRRSMAAVYDASLFVMNIAMEEGIDFMSDSSYGLEMTSPALLEEMDLPYIRKFSEWTHQRGGLFWYHNCGFTSTLIRNGVFNTIGADVIETIAPPPEGDNDLAESRRHVSRNICTKGNLNLNILRDGTPAQITREVQGIVAAVRGYAHIVSTADAVLQGTPPENFLAFVDAAREATHS